MEKVIVAGALGECVHVAGIINFLHLAESAGWKTVFLGPAVPINEIIETARRENASLVGVSYRLTPETGERLLGEFAEAADELRENGVRFIFGGTPPVAARAQKLQFFERIFEGGEPADQVLTYLKGESCFSQEQFAFPQKTIDRIRWKAPYPLIRHHFGLPTVEQTRLGIEQIAEAQVLDVLSLGIDQDAQQNFFHPERQNQRSKGAGGVPVRSAADYEVLYTASRRGNYPLMRTYSGTDDYFKLAEMYVKTINLAWAAVPLFWFNKMDGRGPWDLEGSIREHQRLIEWYGKREIPVELNEPHHWSMRDAPDVIFVVMAFLSAYNARALGVQDYIAQYMFNSPPGTSDAMDLAKMLAAQRLIEPLANQNFHIWTQTRTGLLSYPRDTAAARAHLAASVYLQMALKPHIVHVVGYTEADHAATADDVIESCKMARKSIENAVYGLPEMTGDFKIQSRIKELVDESAVTLQAIFNLAEKEIPDPLIDPHVLSKSVETGILDAPHLRNNPYAQGKIKTRILQGACLTVNQKGDPISEFERLSNLC